MYYTLRPWGGDGGGVVEKDRKGGVYLTREVSEDPDACMCVFTSPRWAGKVGL